jgi:hypothetical protein
MSCLFCLTYDIFRRHFNFVTLLSPHIILQVSREVEERQQGDWYKISVNNKTIAIEIQ